MQLPGKRIPQRRSDLQSSALVWTAGTALGLLELQPIAYRGRHFVHALFVSLTFGLVVWALRAATPAAAFFGSLICHTLTVWTGYTDQPLFRSALTPLAALFALTFAATRLGKRYRPALTPAREARHGRTASQIIANLGFAPVAILLGATGLYDLIPGRTSGIYSASVHWIPVLVLAALAEATADTVSSELGQAFGGTPYLLTTLRPAEPGTDGAVSLLGTAAGTLGATAVAAAGAWAMHLDARQFWTALAGAVAGLFFDSLLGATAERQGYLNNNLVNFASTVFAALVALLLCML